ncbi:hypothetical protein Q8F55_001672 [Vanrija albida]|uniref:F-box domain-containing protein n=1 Tax=Vanrija albida TaxID=181172 RepID=A0ABR3Q7L1_9TREE
MPDTTSVHAVLLSYDMFLAIANELDAADLVSATQVCADWRRALKSSVPWRRACLRESLDEYDPRPVPQTDDHWHKLDHGFETAVLDPATLSELCPDERRGEHVKTHVYNDHDLVMSTNKVKLVILRNFREVFRRAATLATTAERGALLVSHTIVVDFGRPVNKIRVSRTRILLAMAWDMVVLDSRNLPRMPLAPGAPRPTLSALFLRSSIPWPFTLAHARVERNWTRGRFTTTKHSIKFDHSLEGFGSDSRAGVLVVCADDRHDSLLVDRRTLATVVRKPPARDMYADVQVNNGHAAYLHQAGRGAAREVRVCAIEREDAGQLREVGHVPLGPDEIHSGWRLETRADGDGAVLSVVTRCRVGDHFEIGVHDAPWESEGVVLHPQVTDRPAFNVVCYVFLQGFTAYLHARDDETGPLATWPQLEPLAAGLAYRVHLQDVAGYKKISDPAAWEPEVEHVTATGLLPSDAGFDDVFEVPPDWTAGPLRCTFNDHDLIVIAHNNNLLLLRDFRDVFRQAAGLATPAERAALLGSHTIVINFAMAELDVGIAGLRAFRDRFVMWDVVVFDSRDLPRMPLAPGAPRPTLPALALRRAIPLREDTDLNEFNCAWRIDTDTLVDSRAIYLLAERNDAIVAYEFDK